MKKAMTLITLQIILMFSSLAYAVCSEPALPNELSVTERLISMTTTFTVKSGSKGFGNVRRKLISMTPRYDWFDADGNKVATGRRAIISLGAKVDVFDCEGKKIGTIQEKILKSLFGVYSVYSIRNEEGREIAKSRKVDFGSTSFTIIKGGRKVAKLNRPWVRIRDQWNVKILDHRAVDSRLLIMLGVFKTDADNNRE